MNENGPFRCPNCHTANLRVNRVTFTAQEYAVDTLTGRLTKLVGGEVEELTTSVECPECGWFEPHVLLPQDSKGHLYLSYMCHPTKERRP